jgi:hypothetical protein
MTVPSSGAAVRRGGRRPGWLLLTVLLVLAIAASSALVFTDRVELLKLAVILSLWATVVAAFVSVIYRRQSDADQARVRDLKLVYDLQLDREISARREYELTVESQLRRELASELRTQAADEVAALRAELVALRTNLEILFEAQLDQRPALETDRATVRGYSGWANNSDSMPADWVPSNRVTSVRAETSSNPAEESSIIDVPEEPVPRESAADASEAAPGAEEGSNWDSADNQNFADAEMPDNSAGTVSQPPSETPPGSRRARHSGPAETAAAPSGEAEAGGRYAEPDQRAEARQSAQNPDDGDGDTEPSPPSEAVSEQPTPPSTPPAPPEPAARHRSAGTASEEQIPQTGGQSVAELLARLQAEPTGGGRRRRRED